MKLLSFIGLVNFGILLNLIPGQVTQAQIVPDNSLPNNSVVTPDGEVINIEGGTRRGDNLFHSFDEFSIPVDNTAAFNNAVDIQNIFSRVTGNSISEINGILDAQGTASLFLINPNGIIFGESAALDIGGSFLATTAESVLFEDDTQFNIADSQTTPLLTITAPIGLDLGTDPGQIINRSLTVDSSGEFDAGLQVKPGNTIALLGGEVMLEGGNLTADGGKIELGGVAANNLVNLIQDEKGWSFNYEAISDFQDISLNQGAIISSFSDIGGNIQVYGKNVSLTQDSQISLDTSVAKAGNLVVKGSESITIEGIDSGLFNEVNETATGEEAKLNIETEKLSVSGGTITTATRGEGNGSGLNLKTENLIVEDGGQISTPTFGEGNAGDLTIIVSDSILLQGRNSETNDSSGIFAQVNSEATGNAGNLSIQASQLTLLDGAQVSTTARNSGQGGDLKINVADSILLSGTSSVGNILTSQSGIFTSAQSGATGNSGNLELDTGLLTVEQGAVLSASNRGTGIGGNADINVDRLRVRDGGRISAGSLVFDDAVDDIRGVGGTLTIDATNSVEVRGMGSIRDQNIESSSIFTRSEGTGNSGSLSIFTPNLTVAGGGNIDVSASGTGKAGSLNIDAQDITLDRGSFTAETRTGDQGNITLDNADTLLLRNNSQITTNATELATGGDIFINSDGIAALGNSDITANALEGRGGNIQITTQGIFREPDSDITADASEVGIDGTVTFNTPEVDPAAGIFELPDIPIDTENILAQDLCKLEDDKIAKGSSFIITGRGGLTPTSEESLGNRDRIVNWASREYLEVSDSGTVSIRQRDEHDTAKKTYPEIQQSQGLVVADDGSIWLTANAVNKDLQGTKSTHPNCQTQSSAINN